MTLRNLVRWWLAMVALGLGAGPASAQLGTLASPGPLSRAHAALEGLANCQKCHEPGRQVVAAKCLACHAPIADRIARKVGVHRDVTDDCVTCHVEHDGVGADLRPLDTRKFDHARETGFPLDGRHAPLAGDCARCHKTRSFLSVNRNCQSCHADVHRGALGQTCARCHSTAVPFKQAAKTFDHGQAAFALTGAHLQVPCARCHRDQQFKGVRFASCADCHTEPHAKKLGADCTVCHTTATWRTTKVDHARTGFPLQGLHQSLACAKCHVQPPVKVKLTATRCADCHADPHRGQFKESCETCHRETGFKNAAAFDHAARTRFALVGKHATLECGKCHRALQPASPAGRRPIDFRGLKTDCASCHADPHKGELGASCAACHSPESFRVPTFQHPAKPEFFGGSHVGVACAKCHVAAPTAPARTGAPAAGTRFKGTPTACSACHKDPHLGQLGTACEACHAIDAAKFTPVGFRHDRAAFPLTGRHADVPCEKCHKQETASFPAGPGTARRFKGLQTACASCHADPHLGQVGPGCETCHTTRAFAVVSYTHKNLVTFFVGRHKTLECVQCHKKVEDGYPAGRGVAVKFKVGTECSSCHRDAHAGSLGSACAACHSPEDWRNPSRAFHKVTVFPLEGRHLGVPCSACHVKGEVKGTPTRCYDCHWIRRQDDRYKTRLGSECEECHRPVSWTSVRWDHGTRTGLPLNAAHQLLACDSCHKNQVFAGSRPECFACHEKDYRAAQNPSHVAAGFPLQCDLCHRPSLPTFAGATFAHSSFLLVGLHATQPCASCHRNEIYRGTPRDCFGCHQADYQRTQNPNHQAAGFPTACDSCHRPTDPSWRGSATFSHAVFPLSGLHASAACTACHRNGVYKGTPRDCVSCHQADYNQAQNPNHLSAGFPVTCESCHSPGGPGWRGASFNHSQFFALQGVHASQPCAACHRSGQYKGTPRDCVGCHLSNYQATRNPNHVAAGFPTTCEACHRATDTSWNQGRFNHTAFPITSGRHAGNPCSACHQDPNNFKSFTCLTCHDRARTDAQHAGRPGYRYDSNACYSCHPQGRGD